MILNNDPCQPFTVLRHGVDSVGSLRGEGRDDPAPVPRLLQAGAQAGDHDALAGCVHALLVLHAGRQASGAHGSSHVGGGQAGLQEEDRAARQGPRLRTLLQRRGRRRCRSALCPLLTAQSVKKKYYILLQPCAGRSNVVSALQPRKRAPSSRSLKEKNSLFPPLCSKKKISPIVSLPFAAFAGGRDATHNPESPDPCVRT